MKFEDMLNNSNVLSSESSTTAKNEHDKNLKKGDDDSEDENTDDENTDDETTDDNESTEDGDEDSEDENSEGDDSKDEDDGEDSEDENTDDENTDDENIDDDSEDENTDDNESTEDGDEDSEDENSEDDDSEDDGNSDDENTDEENIDDDSEDENTDDNESTEDDYEDSEDDDSEDDDSEDDDSEDGNSDEDDIFRQPQIWPVSQEQLISEVKGIYSGLVMIEAKCIEVDAKQAQVAMKSIARPRLNNEQWQALIALHRTLLHEHHDFLLASQHPSASLSLRKLASKYAMPARMWRHGIHSFLELLRVRLPASFEHMVTFIYLAYSIMALLYEAIPAFANTWIECLGDLSRYGMIVEEGDQHREIWKNVGLFWYRKGVDRTPSVGRLYHHLSILSRPYILQQMFYLSKSLIVGLPFLSARETINILFDPAIDRSFQSSNDESQATDSAFIRVHSLLFQGTNDSYDKRKSIYHDMLNKQIDELKTQFKVQGVYIAICNIAAIWQYGSKTAQMKLLCKDREESKPLANGGIIKEEPLNLTVEGSAADIALQNSIDFAMSTLQLILDRENNPDCHPHVLVFLALFNHLLKYPEAMAMTVDYVPWKSLVKSMNLLMLETTSEESYLRILDSDNFPKNELGRPLPEDILLRGLDITKRYFPANHFQREVDNEECFQELPSFLDVRRERQLWLMVRFAKNGSWINFNDEEHCFSTFQHKVEREGHDIRRLNTHSLSSTQIPSSGDKMSVKL